MDFQYTPPPQQSTCMLCDTTTKFEFVHKLRDDKTRNVYQCGTCGHIQIIPLPSHNDDEWYYQSNQMYKSALSQISKFQNEENLMNKYRAFSEDEFKYFKKYINKNQKIIDIGAGYGWFVELMRNKGYEVDGVEISTEKRQLVEQRSGIKLFCWNLLYDISDAHKDYYDVISLIHVLEHISDPKTFLKKAAELLKPNGMIYIEVPNFDDYIKILVAEYDAFSYFRGHLSYFTAKTLSNLLINTGFKNIKIFGHQNYSFENALWWMREKRPFLDYHQIDVPECLQWLNTLYKERVESEMKSTSLIGIGYRDN